MDDKKKAVEDRLNDSAIEDVTGGTEGLSFTTCSDCGRPIQRGKEIYMGGNKYCKSCAKKKGYEI